jgi:hypothetical protein
LAGRIFVMRLSLVCIAAILAPIGSSGCIVVFPAVGGRFERALNAAGPADLDIATGAGNIEVRAGSAGVVGIHGWIKVRDEVCTLAEEDVHRLEADPPIEASGNVIRIGRIDDSRRRDNSSISYQIEAPPDTRLAARAGSGSIAIADIEGDVHAQTGSGSVEVGSVTVRSEQKGLPGPSEPAPQAAL